MSKKRKLTRKPAFYERDSGEYRFACDEHDELEILVFNCVDLEDAATKVREFLEWLHHHIPQVVVDREEIDEE